MFRTRLFGILLLCSLSQSIIRAQEPLVIDLGEGVSIELVRISKGQFLQGSHESEQGREADEVTRTVVLSRDFYLGTTPVTVGQFRRFVAATRYKTEAESGPSGGFGVVDGKLVQQPQFHWDNPGYPLTDEHPVTIVTVADATAFLKWLSGVSGRSMVLPTEAQWEYACRAGSTSRFYNGDDDTAMDAIGWSERNSASAPKPVKQKQPNAFGLYEMSGNVYEWCQDVYNIYPPDAVTDPLQMQGQPGEKLRNVLRGGSWMRLPKRCRSAARYRATPGTRNAENGFRVATMDLQAPVATAVASAQPQVAANNSSPMAEPVPNADTPSSGQFVNQPAVVSPGESSSGGAGVFFFFVFTLLMGWLGRKIYRAFASYDVETSNTISETRPNRPEGKAGFAIGMMSGFFQAEKDGFWISTERYSMGTMLECEYWADKKLFMETVEVTSPDRQFVYTGSPPTDIKIRVSNAVSPPADLNNPYATTSWTSETGPTSPPNNPQTYVFVDPTRATSSRPDPVRDDSAQDRSTSRGTGFPPAY